MFCLVSGCQIDGKDMAAELEALCVCYVLQAVGFLLRSARYIHSLTLCNLGVQPWHMDRMLSTAGYSVVPHTLQVRDNKI